MSKNVFFTSDTHFGHSKVIDYSKRPFRDVEEMDEALIRRWNACVKPGDFVYHLGDLSFHDAEKSARIAARLQGQKYLVLGNHDKKMKDAVKNRFIWARDYAEIKVADQKIVLCHYAFLTWNGSHKGSWSLHGHSHGSLKPDQGALRLDVGVDCWDYAPINFEALRYWMGKKQFTAVDHHGRRGEEE